MEYEKSMPSPVERVIEIDGIIKGKRVTDEMYGSLIAEKEKLLLNFTEEQLEQFVDYTMAVINNSRSRKEVKEDIKHLITNLKSKE